MNTFLLIAALMAAIAAAAVAYPLLRDRQSRLAGGMAAMAVLAAAAGLYPLWSNWDWHAPPPAPRVSSSEILGMVGKLEQHMKEHPDDALGWVMLGRSYVALERLDDGVAAYQHAHLLDVKNVEATLGLGEALSVRAGGDITPQSAELFEQALLQAPDNPKALLYGGFAALGRGDRALAKDRWEALKNLNPPPQIVAMLDARIAELEGAAGTPAAGRSAPVVAPNPLNAAPGDGATAAVGSPSAGPPVASSPAASSPAAGTPAAGTPAQATLLIRLAPALQAKVTGDTPLFLFAREPGGRGPPLAAKRLTATAIGSMVRLTDADSMLPGRTLKSGQRVSITARLSFSGQPLPAAGDLYGEVFYDVGRDTNRELIIDRVAE